MRKLALTAGLVVLCGASPSLGQDAPGPSPEIPVQAGDESPEPTAPPAPSASPEANAPPELSAPAPDKRADEPSLRASEPRSDTPATSQTPGKKAKKKKEKGGVAAHLGALGAVSVRGRAIVELSLSEQPLARVDEAGDVSTTKQPSLDFGLGSNRLKVDWRTPVSWLSGQVSVGVNENRLKTKNVYLEAKKKWFAARAGQFKTPTSVLDVESSWDLPMGKHDAFSDLLEDALMVGGRRIGAMASFRAKAWSDLTLSVGAFQGSTLVADELVLLDKAGVGSVGAAVRLSVEAGPVRFGSWLQDRRYAASSLEPPEGHLAAGLDSEAEFPLFAGTLRLWADVSFGDTWITSTARPDGLGTPLYGLGRLIAGYRFGGAQQGDFYVEPFVVGGLFDPDLKLSSDRAWEAQAGVNVGLWKVFRGSLQGQWTDADSYFPTGYASYAVAATKSLTAQMGAAF